MDKMAWAPLIENMVEVALGFAWNKVMYLDNDESVEVFLQAEEDEPQVIWFAVEDGDDGIDALYAMWRAIEGRRIAYPAYIFITGGKAGLRMNDVDFPSIRLGDLAIIIIEREVPHRPVPSQRGMYDKGRLWKKDQGR